MLANYYTILGLNTNATASEIKAAYRRLALKYHPDKNPGSDAAAEMMKKINAAYHILGDTSKKTSYDFKLGITSKTSTYSNTSYRYQHSTSTYSNRYNHVSDKEFMNLAKIILGGCLLAAACAITLFIMAMVSLHNFLTS